MVLRFPIMVLRPPWILLTGQEIVILLVVMYMPSRLHRTRFGEMEPGLPDQYQEEERLSYLRETHEDLISDGMQIISDSYLAPLAQQAKALNLSFEAATPEGHHYV